MHQLFYNLAEYLAFDIQEEEEEGEEEDHLIEFRMSYWVFL